VINTMQIKALRRITLIGTILCLLFITGSTFGQSSIVVPKRVEGWYWLVSPKPWFTRQLTVSVGNRTLEKDDHDESLPTRPGYYHRLKEDQPFVCYSFKSIVVKNGRTSFRTNVIRGRQFIFNGQWGTEHDASSGIDNVPFFRGKLSTYKNGKLVKTERVKFSHAVNA